MSRRLRIGKSGRSAFTLPPEIATQASAIHGVRGKGKTVTAAVIVEELLGLGVQVVVIDPTDVWWGLKSSADGKKVGHDIVILGGSHADLPLQSTSGAVIADFTVDHGASLILSLRHLRKNEQRRFVTDFAEQLFHRKGQVENRTPLFLAIDEASQYVPQRVMGDSARMVGAIQDIVRLGRSAGLGCALIDQRPATVNKDVLTQIELLVCHAVTSPQDRKALTEWIRQKDSAGREKEFLEDLASLGRGEAWFWHPIQDVFQRVSVRMRETFDSSKTPELGGVLASPEVRAEVDLEQLRGALEETIAEAEANDPKALHRRIADLEKQLRERTASIDQDEISLRIADEVATLTAANLRRLRPALNSLRSIAQVLEELSGEGLSNVVSGLEAVVADSEAPRLPDRRMGSRVEPQRTRPTPVRRTPAEGISGPQQRILDALAALEQLGLEEVAKSIVAVFSDASPKSSAFANNLGFLRSQRGLIDYPRGGFVRLTDAGRAVADPGTAPHTLAELHEAWTSKLSGPQGRILAHLTLAYPAELTRDELADRAGASPGSSAYANNLGRMRSLGIIDYPSRGRVRATELLFPRGLT